MPLNSRLSRKPVPVSEDTEKTPAAEPTTSPRKRTAPPPTLSDPARPENEASVQPESENPPESPPEREAPPAPKKRGPKPGTRRRKVVELPPDAAESVDPAVLREVLKLLEANMKGKRIEYEEATKALVAQYKAVSAKLADALV